MPRNKHKNAKIIQGTKAAESAQLALIEKIENQVRKRTEEQKLQALAQKQIVKKMEATITLVDGIQYGAVDLIPSFTVHELSIAMNLSSFIDMSEDLKADVAASQMFLRFANNCDDPHPEFRIYMRNKENFHHFALLQRCIEKMYMIEPQADLQGWIIHYGTLFIFGGVRFSLEESINRVKESMHDLFLELQPTDLSMSTLRIS